MISAVITVCLLSAPQQCDRREFKVEPRACHIAPLAAQAPLMGEWQSVQISIRCK